MRDVYYKGYPFLSRNNNRGGIALRQTISHLIIMAEVHGKGAPSLGDRTE